MKAKHRLCIDVFTGFEYGELLPMAKRAGFDGFFSGEVYADNLKVMSHCLFSRYRDNAVYHRQRTL